MIDKGGWPKSQFQFPNKNHSNETIEKSNVTIETIEGPNRLSRRQLLKLADHLVFGESERSGCLGTTKDVLTGEQRDLNLG